MCPIVGSIPPVTSLTNPPRGFLSCRFEDSDFLGELQKPEDQRAIKCSKMMQEEAVEVWKQYYDKPDTVHY